MYLEQKMKSNSRLTSSCVKMSHHLAVVLTLIFLCTYPIVCEDTTTAATNEQTTRTVESTADVPVINLDEQGNNHKKREISQYNATKTAKDVVEIQEQLEWCPSNVKCEQLSGDCLD